MFSMRIENEYGTVMTDSAYTDPLVLTRLRELVRQVEKCHKSGTLPPWDVLRIELKASE